MYVAALYYDSRSHLSDTFKSIPLPLTIGAEMVDVMASVVVLKNRM